jgi:hypothetical protein
MSLLSLLPLFLAGIGAAVFFKHYLNTLLQPPPQSPPKPKTLKISQVPTPPTQTPPKTI